jgi:iron complex outermembrane receptor protein
MLTKSIGRSIFSALILISFFITSVGQARAQSSALDASTIRHADPIPADPDPAGSIKGVVTTSDGKPASDVTIVISGTNKYTLTDGEGKFTFRHLQPGQYWLEISLVGYETTKQPVVVTALQVVNLNIRLNAAQRLLDELTVTGFYNKFNKKETEDIARLPLKNLENPQAYTVVTREIMQEQQITDYASIFKNIPGAGIPVVYNQGRTSLFARGFMTDNLIRNSVSGFVYTNIDPANLQRVEAIKGPSGTLFNSNMISFGGLFNRVTKKPIDRNFTEIGYSAASFDLNRLAMDLNRVLDTAHKALFRFNTAAGTQQSFQDAGFSRNIMLAPSFSYKVNDRLSLLLDVEATLFTATSPIRFAPASTGKINNIKDLGIDYKRSFTNNSLSYKTQQLNVFGQVNYQLAENWRSQTNYTRTYSATKGYVTQLIGRSDSILQQQAQVEDFPYNGTEIQQNFIGDTRIGHLRNRVVIGVDVYNQKSNRNTPTITMPVINFLHPGAAYNNFNAAKVDSAAARAAYQVYRTNQNIYGVYVSDVINITSQLNVMLSLRGDRFDNKGTYYPAQDSTVGAYTQNALSPKLGIVYEILPDRLSLFGNYMNGFSNTGGADYDGVSFKPQQAYQWEGGVKLDLLGHRISSTISYYHIDVSNTTRDDPDHPGYSIQDGVQLSRGVEAEVIANPIPGFNVVAGYSYNESRYTRSNKNVEGLRPATAGPQTLANCWLSYRLISGKLRGFGAGFGGNYGSASYQTNTTAFSFQIPSYTVLDATIFYDQLHYRLGVKVDNLTNEKYWSYRLAPQMPVRVTADIIIKF